MVQTAFWSGFRSALRGLRTDWIQRGDRQFLNGGGGSRRYRADPGSGVPGVFLGMRLQRWRSILPSAQEAEWFSPGFVLDTLGRGQKSQAAMDQLYQQPDRGRGRSLIFQNSG